jgi:hypothetical protein
MKVTIVAVQASDMTLKNSGCYELTDGVDGETARPGRTHALILRFHLDFDRVAVAGNNASALATLIDTVGPVSPSETLPLDITSQENTPDTEL